MSFLMVHFVLFKKLLGFYWEGVGFPRLLLWVCKDGYGKTTPDFKVHY